MVPYRVGSAWEVNAPAKLNLYLDVLGPRADGFHDLETLMVPVRTCDQLRWSDPGDGSALSLRIRAHRSRDSLPKLNLGPSAENLVSRAAERLAKVAGVEPRGSFDLFKRIPVQSGMGGGSSDAAAALLLANEAWEIGYSRERLAAIAVELGSDVPFFLGQGAAVCRGRGERIAPVSRLPKLHFVVIQPPVGLSTADVFGQWKQQAKAPVGQSIPNRTGVDDLLESLFRGRLAEVGNRLVNRLELAAATLTPWIEKLRLTLGRCGSYGQLMTGSGSACFALMRSASHARSVAGQFSGMGLGRVFVTSSCL